MTWSPFFTEVTPAPTSTTTPAPSWPRIAGNSPSGSAPERVNSSVWQMPVAFDLDQYFPVLWTFEVGLYDFERLCFFKGDCCACVAAELSRRSLIAQRGRLDRL